MSKFILPIRFAIAISGSLIGYFLLIALFDWHTNPLFSLFNGVITGFGLYEVVKYTKLEKGKEFQYGDGFTAGLVSGFGATLIFTLFFGIYAGNLAPDFLENLVGPWSGTASLGVTLFTVAIGGFATSIVMTLCLMQLFKPSWNTTGTKRVLKERGDAIKGN